MNPETGLELQFFELDNPLDNKNEARVLLLGGVDAHAPGSLPNLNAELSSWFGAHNLCALALLNAPENDAETATTLDWIAGIGGDVVSLAGLVGGSLPQIRLASGKIELLGAGTTEAEAFRPAVINMDDVRIGLLAVSERRATGFDGRADILHPMLYDRVRMLQAQCDHVIVFCHAGLPNASLPLPEWRARYRRFVDAGATIVVGQPPNGVSGWEEYRNGLVFYGLGTLANEREDAGCRSLAVSLALERNGRFRYETCLLERSGEELQLSGNEAEKQAINQTNALFFDEKAYLAQSTALCRETYNAWKRDTCASHAPGFGRGLLNALLPQSAEQARREDEANLRALLENESLRLAVLGALSAREAEKSGRERMKILWLVSSLLPQIARLTGEPEQPFGGWLVSMLDGLLADPQHQVFVCYRASGAQRRGESGRLSYCSFEQDTLQYSPQNEVLFAELLVQAHPDVVHIWGTEYPSALAMIRAAERRGMLDRTVVSIQGLTSVYARHYTAGLPQRVVNGCTVRDFLRRDNISKQQRKYARRGGFEVLALQKARHVIGRTRWDKACVRQINSNAVYHVCNESLREPFYSGKWDVSSCERHTIFVSQGDYPIKGLHEALYALPYLIKDFPDVRLITTGKDPRGKSARERLQRSSYAVFLANEIRRLGLDDHVEFLGALSAEQMKQRYLSAHVALNPSSIENSSNAICEAMLLGTPVVASFVGGTPDMVADGVSGLLYPFDAPYLLADAVRQVFSSDKLAAQLSSEARKSAAARHDREQNLKGLLAIYRELAAAPETE